jgi:GNAT superfamily N-acetyltransferase
VASRKDRKAFIQFPYDLYRDCDVWVPPLRMDIAKLINPRKNAFFEHGDMQLFLARDMQGTVIGRIAAIVNGMHLKKYDDASGFFGFFDVVDDYAVAKGLLDAAAAWLKNQGLSTMRGPTNPSMNDVAGLLINGFDRQPAILMPYNHPWFEGFLLQYGFERSMTMWAYYVHAKTINLPKLERGTALLKRRYPDISIRTLDKTRFDEEAHLIMDIYNDAWSENWGHVPMTDGEFKQLASEMKQIIDERLVVFAEKEGETIGFAVLLPDLNYALKTIPDGRLFPTGLIKLLVLGSSGVIRETRMPLMGVRKAYQGRAIDTMLVNEVVINGIGMGYMAAEMSWVLDSNQVLKNSLESLGSIRDKEYAMFETAIT